MKTPNLELPEFGSAGIPSGIELTRGFRRLDAIVQLAVIAIQSTPPIAPLLGDRYIVDSGTDDWDGHDRHVAFWSQDGWVFFIPRHGWQAVVDASSFVIFKEDVQAWVSIDIDFYSPATTKGDLLAHDGSTLQRLSVGADGYALISDDAQPLGLRYANISAGGGGGNNLAVGFYWYDHFFYQASTSGNTWDLVTSGTGASVDWHGEDKHPGICRLGSGTTTTGQALAFLTADQSNANFGRTFVLSATDVLIMDAVVKMPSAATAAQNYAARWGLRNNASGTDRVEIGARHNGTAWVWGINVTAAGVVVVTDAATGPTANAWHHVELRMTTATVLLYVDGSLRLTITSGIPTAPMTAGFGVVKTAGTTAVFVDTDLIRISQDFATPAF